MLTDTDALNTRIIEIPTRSLSSGAHCLHHCLKKAEILAMLSSISAVSSGSDCAQSCLGLGGGKMWPARAPVIIGRV